MGNFASTGTRMWKGASLASWDLRAEEGVISVVGSPDRTCEGAEAGLKYLVLVRV